MYIAHNNSVSFSRLNFDFKPLVKSSTVHLTEYSKHAFRSKFVSLKDVIVFFKSAKVLILLAKYVPSFLYSSTIKLFDIRKAVIGLLRSTLSPDSASNLEIVFSNRTEISVSSGEDNDKIIGLGRSSLGPITRSNSTRSNLITWVSIKSQNRLNTHDRCFSNFLANSLDGSH